MTVPESDPYASPKCGTFYVPIADATMCDVIYRRKDLLIVRRGSAPYLPCDTCFKCGGQAVKTVHRTFYWHHPGLYSLIFLFLLPYVLFAAVTRKKMELTVGLCARHAASRRRLLTAVIVVFSLGVVALVLSTAWSRESAFLRVRQAGGVLMIVSMALAFVASNGPGQAQSITDREGTIAGAGEGYLQRFPAGDAIARSEQSDDAPQANDTKTEAGAGVRE